MKTVVLISADAEWRAATALFPDSDLTTAPLGEHFEITVAGRLVKIFHGGWGRVSAAATTQYAIDQWKPDLLVNLGTCGGFAGRIQQGEIILVERTVIYDILEQMGDAEAALRHYSTDLELGWLGGHTPMPVKRGVMVSGDRDIVSGDIPGLITKYGAVAADWESGAIAWVAHRNHTRLLILRGVSDLVGSTGGEAYGEYDLFLRRSAEIMSQLFEVLPQWLQTAADAWAP